MGLVAILFWSTTIAVSRHLADEIGALTAAACTWLAAGVLGCGWAVASSRMGRMVRLPRAYLAACGGCFVAYMVCLYLAIGLARSDQQAIEVGILNYLWPSLTLVLAVPVLGLRPRPLFWLGVAVALAGASLAPLRLEEFSLSPAPHRLQEYAAALGQRLAANPLPYVLAAAAAVLWALYSVLSRRLAGEGAARVPQLACKPCCSGSAVVGEHGLQATRGTLPENGQDASGNAARPTLPRDAGGGAVPLFALAAGVVLLALRPVLHEPADWSWRAGGELAFMAVFPALIAYAFWDRAMRRGSATLVAAASYAIPLVSTILSSLYLGVAIGPTLWVACGLVVAGAVMAQRGSAECRAARAV
jgi:drug/metabolite transporter (DMT)-like permease